MIMAITEIFYPSILHLAGEGGYWISFPDLPECFSEADSIEEAHQMATEALDLALNSRLETHEELPEPSDIKLLDLHDNEQIINVTFCF
jgi:antitoxin HicB